MTAVPFNLKVGEVISGKQSQIRFVRVERYPGKGDYKKFGGKTALRFESIGTEKSAGSTRTILLFPKVVRHLVARVRKGYLTRAALKSALENRFGETHPALSGVDHDYINLALHLGNEAQNADLPDDAPSGTALRRVLVRQGQQEFRRRIFRLYGGRCFITGCEIASLLDAAHIVPFSKSKSNTISNGILLRTDIHTLFDLHLIRIIPTIPSGTVRLALAESVLSDPAYASLNDEEFSLPEAVQKGVLKKLRKRNR